MGVHREVRVSVHPATEARLHSAQLAEVRVAGLGLGGWMRGGEVGSGSVHLASTRREKTETENTRWVSADEIILETLTVGFTKKVLLHR